MGLLVDVREWCTYPCCGGALDYCSAISAMTAKCWIVSTHMRSIASIDNLGPTDIAVLSLFASHPAMSVLKQEAQFAEMRRLFWMPTVCSNTLISACHGGLQAAYSSWIRSLACWMYCTLIFEGLRQFHEDKVQNKLRSSPLRTFSADSAIRRGSALTTSDLELIAPLESRASVASRMIEMIISVLSKVIDLDRRHRYQISPTPLLRWNPCRNESSSPEPLQCSVNSNRLHGLVDWYLAGAMSRLAEWDLLNSRYGYQGTMRRKAKEARGAFVDRIALIYLTNMSILATMTFAILQLNSCTMILPNLILDLQPWSTSWLVLLLLVVAVQQCLVSEKFLEVDLEYCLDLESFAGQLHLMWLWLVVVDQHCWAPEMISEVELECCLELEMLVDQHYLMWP